jgi:hypothetical protein
VRILITGSRNWTNQLVIADSLFRVATRYDVDDDELFVLVSGNCPTGADNMAEKCARMMGWEVEPHPADWNTHGKKAGFLRNAEMVNLGADLCLAFILDASKGATHTANLAEKAGIKTIRILDNSTI